MRNIMAGKRMLKNKQPPKKRRANFTKPSANLLSVSTASASAPSRAEETRPNSIVGIGASAGGLEAFEQLLAALPSDSGMAFVLVQHLAPKHESILSELLARATPMPVMEITEGTAVRPNHVYVIPPNADMSILDGVLHLSPLGPDRARRMPIDMFLRSLAEDQQGQAIGVILSGTASDGTMGLEAIKANGGITFAQDQESAKYSAMPRSAVAAGNVDFILPPARIARELTRIAKHIHIFAPDDATELPEVTKGSDTLNKIYSLLRSFSRVDFSYYKPGTLKRRITRRMFLRKMDSLEGYLAFLRKNREEVEGLFNDFLINVTSFFRDPDAFEGLISEGFPFMLRNKPPNAPIRVWVPGCSTGEEAYSLAVAFLEFLGEQAANRPIQIFATDVSETIIQRARAGIYPESIAMDISADRLKRFFQKANGGFLVGKAVRDICVFAKQDIAKDPPFSKMDLISCRNVMIYMGPLLQKRIISLFHYALNPNGVLFLGSSETVGGFNDLFTTIDKKHKIYSKKSVEASVHFEFVPRYDVGLEAPKLRQEGSRRVDLQKSADQVLLNRFVPASVVVNDKMEVLQFIGQTGRFFDPTPGDATLNLLKLVKGGLQLELRLAFQKAKRSPPIRKEGVLVQMDGSLKTANFEILLLKSVPGRERYYLIVFEEGKPLHRPQTSRDGKGGATKKSAKLSDIEVENVQLKEELDATREYLQSIIEEQRTTNEELRSANEEIQSSNEELQSINEELETAKEELQSTNEELTTVNEELQNRNDELSRVNNDLNNVLSSVNIPILMLGTDLHIRRFTPVTERVMNLIPTDIGRPITDIKSNVRIPDLRQLVTRVVDSLEIHESEVEDNDGKWYSMKIRPYRTLDNKIDGVVIVLIDLDPRLQGKHERKPPLPKAGTEG
jgi:two-component system CheB/CheR fusion protein